jgi:hypothetical protein
MDDIEADEIASLEVTDPELWQLLGLFDAPAFARRGQDLEYGLARLRARCRCQREEMLDMVRLRLRQWAGAVTGPDAWPLAFDAPIDPLWSLSDAEPPTWADQTAPPRRLRAIARDLIASIERFNRRWARFLGEIDLGAINRMIDQYNRYYILEKECSLGSSRLAARHFTPQAHLTAEALREELPTLPVPVLRGDRRP